MFVILFLFLMNFSLISFIIDPNVTKANYGTPQYEITDKIAYTLYKSVFYFK